MLPNYFKVAVRNLFRQKSYFFVNVCGLAIGMAACLLIIGYVFNEMSFEDCHERADRIYRIQGLYKSGGSTLPMACAVAPLAPLLREEIPEIETVACFNYEHEFRVKVGREEFEGNTLLLAGPELLEVFTLPLARGNPQTALEAPFSVVLSEEMAHKHYGTANPLGEFITVADAFECRITGVLEKIPDNTQIRGDVIICRRQMSTSAPPLIPDPIKFLCDWNNTRLISQPIDCAGVSPFRWFFN